MGAIEDLRSRLGTAGLEALAREAAFYLAGELASRFRSQGTPPGSWPARAAVNRIGILRDLEAGRTPPARRFQPRPAGIDTGQLRGSAFGEATGGGRLRFGLRAEHASSFQRGGRVAIAVERGSALRRRLAAFLRRRKDLRAALGPLFTLGALDVAVPPRPVVVLTAANRARLLELAAARLARVGG